MARCYHCGKVLSDDWIRKQGASLLGRKGGLVKARTSEQAREASRVRWNKVRKDTAAKLELAVVKKRKRKTTKT